MTSPFAAATRDHAEEHPRRKFILDLLAKEGPQPARRLILEGKMSRSACIHHIRNLQARGRIRAQLVGRRLMFALNDRTAPGPETVPSELAQKVLALAASQPQIRQREIAKEAGVTQSYVSRVLKRYSRNPETTNTTAGASSPFANPAPSY